MGKRIYITCVLFLFVFRFLLYGEVHKIIIDTDAAPDDMRAICMLLSREDVDVLAITTCDGALDPLTGARKVRALLHQLDQEQIPVGIGRKLQAYAPVFRPFCETFFWGDEIEEGDSFLTAEELITEVVKKNEGVTILCLGPMINIANILNDPVYNEIQEIYWYSNYTILMNTPCFNYDRDSLSAQKVMYSGIPVKILSNLDKEQAMFDRNMLEVICKGTNPYAKLVCESHSKAEVFYDKIENGHFKIWDELLVLYYLFPEYFEAHRFYKDYPVSIVTDYDVCKARDAMEIIFCHSETRQHVVFSVFPYHSEEFREDLAPYVEAIREKHGEEEWKVCVLTHEMHGHLGIYSLVGAKMGIRAREYFNVGTDQLEVISYAGIHPPVSCLNDGLQVSTGATLGQGTITIIADILPEPAAAFKYKGRTIKIAIKPEYRRKFKTDIEDALIRYDLSDDGYWQLIRDLAIKYWLELDRNELFEIHEMEQD